MGKAIYKDLHPASKIALVALIALIGLIAFMVLSALLAVPFFGAEAFTGLLNNGLTVDESNFGLLKFFQMAQSIGLFVFPAIIAAFLFGGKLTSYLNLKRRPYVFSGIMAIVIILLASPLINVLGVWNAEMQLPDFLHGIEQWMKQSEESAAQLTELFVKADTVGVLLFNILLIGIIPAIGEEFLFRGVIQRIFSEWTKNHHVAIWLTAILFSALHLQFYGFIPRALLGAMFGYMFVWSGNLWLPVLAHFVNNTAAVFAYYLYGKGSISIDPDSIGVGTAYQIAAIISLIFVIVFFLFYYRYEKMKRLKA
ncbi:MAG: CPBP family intramembrane metalloprotease [Prolixibacteraceae bacterium]|nr:CPBP family intramembrane metalloprotease [Prolixibacteraceae bacterium]